MLGIKKYEHIENMNINYETLEYYNLSNNEIADVEEVLLLTENVDQWNNEVEKLGGERVYGSKSPEVLFMRSCPKNYFTSYKDGPHCRFPELLDEMEMPSYALSFAWPRMNPNLVSIPLGRGEIRRLHRLVEHQVRLLNPRMIVFMDEPLKFYNAYVAEVNEEMLTHDITETWHVAIGRLATFTMSPAALLDGNNDDFIQSMEYVKDELEHMNNFGERLKNLIESDNA